MKVTANQDYWISLSLGCHFCVFELSRQIPKTQQVPKLVKTRVTLFVLRKTLCEYGYSRFPVVGSIKIYLVKENL